mmetsp:Transcript_33455/g.75055  ORF Transcript_33455/g.75055 Transcript_33455/m.75055 type:complete len:302 (+) Transcript_33455:339-1244(+)
MVKHVVISQRNDVSGSLLCYGQCYFSKEIPCNEAVNLLIVHHDLNSPVMDEVHGVPFVPCVDHRLPGPDLDDLQSPCDVQQDFGVDAVEDGEFSDQQERTMVGVEGMLLQGLFLLGEPLVLQALRRAQPPLGVDDEHLLDQVLRRVGDTVPVRGGEREISGADELEQLCVGVGVEGKKPAQHDVDHDPHRPDVHLRAVADGDTVGVDDFRCHVVRGSAYSSHRLLLKEDLRQPEVCDLDGCVVRRLRVVGGIEEVLGLQISVGDAQAVQVSYRVQDVHGDFLSVLLLEAIVLDDAIQNGAS